MPWVVILVTVDGSETMDAPTKDRALAIYRALIQDSATLFACAGPKGGQRGSFMAYIPDGMKWAF